VSRDEKREREREKERESFCSLSLSLSVCLCMYVCGARARVTHNTYMHTYILCIRLWQLITAGVLRITRYNIDSRSLFLQYLAVDTLIISYYNVKIKFWTNFCLKERSSQECPYKDKYLFWITLRIDGTFRYFQNALNIPSVKIEEDKDPNYSVGSTTTIDSTPPPAKSFTRRPTLAKLHNFTTMTPQQIAQWIDKRSRIVFPISFIIFNILYWSFIWIWNCTVQWSILIESSYLKSRTIVN